MITVLGMYLLFGFLFGAAIALEGMSEPDPPSGPLGAVAFVCLMAVAWPVVILAAGDDSNWRG